MKTKLSSLWLSRGMNHSLNCGYCMMSSGSSTLCFWLPLGWQTERVGKQQCRTKQNMTLQLLWGLSLCLCCVSQLDHDLKHAHELRQAAFKLYASLGANDEDIRKKVTRGACGHCSATEHWKAAIPTLPGASPLWYKSVEMKPLSSINRNFRVAWNWRKKLMSCYQSITKVKFSCVSIFTVMN